VSTALAKKNVLEESDATMVATATTMRWTTGTSDDFGGETIIPQKQMSRK
jgi:hypothetical protein